MLIGIGALILAAVVAWAIIVYRRRRNAAAGQQQQTAVADGEGLGAGQDWARAVVESGDQEIPESDFDAPDVQEIAGVPDFDFSVPALFEQQAAADNPPDPTPAYEPPTQDNGCAPSPDPTPSYDPPPAAPTPDYCVPAPDPAPSSTDYGSPSPDYGSN